MQIFILDFGISCELDNGFDKTKIEWEQGTKLYKAPEMISDDFGETSEKSDIWATAVVIHESITF